MLRAHSVEKVRAAEERAAAELGWDALMQHAAAALAVTVARLVPPDETILALVGPGNNGGDALYAAANLRQRGRKVNVLLLTRGCVHSSALAAATAAGVEFVESPEGHAWVIDGLFGIGGRPGLDRRDGELARWQQQARPFTIAVDCPSGIGVDDGTLPEPAAGEYFRADHTVTFGTYKPGLLLGPSADVCGQVEFADISIHAGEPDVEAIEASDGALLGEALFGGVVDKYSRGVLGVAAGSVHYPGAAHLAVAGALAGPAGMVRFRGAGQLAARVIDRAPEVVATEGRVQAWVVGPGGGADVAELLAAALADDVPVVVDAAALAALPERLRPEIVLTPHAGELAQMLGIDRAQVEADPLAHAIAASERWGATVLLKGKRTLVVSPQRPTRVNLSGTPWLATAGAGDVLAGLIGSLLAAGLPPHDAAAIGAFLHGAAAVAANPGGPVTASDVAVALPRTIAAFLDDSLEEVQRW